MDSRRQVVMLNERVQFVDPEETTRMLFPLMYWYRSSCLTAILRSCSRTCLHRPCFPFPFRVVTDSEKQHMSEKGRREGAY